MQLFLCSQVCIYREGMGWHWPSLKTLLFISIYSHLITLLKCSFNHFIAVFSCYAVWVPYVPPTDKTLHTAVFLSYNLLVCRQLLLSLMMSLCLWHPHISRVALLFVFCFFLSVNSAALSKPMLVSDWLHAAEGGYQSD